MSKDYYRILGVLDDAEDVVIRAAYKALAQRYHPDKWTGNKDEANRRMQEINEAYAVLSDSAKRKQYDETRINAEYEEQDDSANYFYASDEIDDAWKSVIEYFPDLIKITERLRKISHQIENSYKITLLEKKEFNRRGELAIAFENYFLEKYFGTNKKILEFAKELVVGGYRDAAKELNHAVSILGSDVNPSTIISRINEKFFNGYDPHVSSLVKKRSVDLANNFMRNNTPGNACTLIKQVGGFINQDFGFFSSSYIVTYKNKKYELSTSELITLASEIAKDLLSEK
jgi:curved DNA-binding protein CbpA